MFRVIGLTLILFWLPTTAVGENLEFCEKANKAQIAKDYKLAISHYIQCVENGDLSVKNQFLALYNRGNAYLINHQFGNAIADFNRAIQLDSTHTYAWNNRGNALTRTGQYDRAISDYNKAIQLAPNDDVPLFNRGNAYNAKKQFDAAIENYSGAIHLNKTNAAAYNNRGNSYRQTGRYDLAIKDFDAALRLNPNNAFTYYNRGFAYAGKLNYERAHGDFSEAIRLKPNHASAYTGRGRTRFFSGLYDGAIADFKSALLLRPNDPYPAIWLYLSQIRSGREGRQELVKNAPIFSNEEWPNPIIKMLLGRTTFKATLGQATDADPVKHREKKTEVYFYAGQQELTSGSRADAVKYFRSTLKIGITYFIEYASAKAELKRLGY